MKHKKKVFHGKSVLYSLSSFCFVPPMISVLARPLPRPYSHNPIPFSPFHPPTAIPQNTSRPFAASIRSLVLSKRPISLYRLLERCESVLMPLQWMNFHIMFQSMLICRFKILKIVALPVNFLPMFKLMQDHHIAF